MKRHGHGTKLAAAGLAGALLAGGWAAGQAQGAIPRPAARLRETGVSQIELREARIGDALDTLRDAALAADPEGVGVNIIYRGPPPEQVPRITLRLRNVSLYDALRYVTELSGLRFRIEERAVIVTAADAPEGPVITRFYPVQPGFTDVLRSMDTDREPEPPPFYFQRR